MARDSSIEIPSGEQVRALGQILIELKDASERASSALVSLTRVLVALTFILVVLTIALVALAVVVPLSRG